MIIACAIDKQIACFLNFFSILRSSREYCGLVQCVALDTERITTQLQTEIHFKAQVDVKENPSDIVKPIKSKVTQEDGVVNLEILKESANDDEHMSSDSEVEMVIQQPTIKSPAKPEKVYEQIGMKFSFSIILSAFTELYLDLGDDSEEEPVVLQDSETK